MPDISVIIPAYNAARFLPDTVASVRRQTFLDWELIIVDDGSTDETLTVAWSLADSDARIRVVHKENGGVAESRNFGFANASACSPFVIFLDHDDVWPPDALASLRQALNEDPAAAAAHGQLRLTDFSGADWMLDWQGRPCQDRADGIAPRLKYDGRHLVAARPEEPTTLAMFLTHNSLYTPGMILIRRSSLPDQLFDQSVAPADDWDFWFRLSLRGHFAFINQVVIQWRQHEHNSSHNVRRMKSAIRAVRRKALVLPELRDRQLSPLMDRERRQEILALTDQYVRGQHRNATVRHRRLAHRHLLNVINQIRGRRWRRAVLCVRHTFSNYMVYLRLRHFHRTHRIRCSYLAKNVTYRGL